MLLSLRELKNEERIREFKIKVDKHRITNYGVLQWCHLGSLKHNEGHLVPFMPMWENFVGLFPDCKDKNWIDIFGGLFENKDIELKDKDGNKYKISNKKTSDTKMSGTLTDLGESYGLVPNGYNRIYFYVSGASTSICNSINRMIRGNRDNNDTLLVKKGNIIVTDSIRDSNTTSCPSIGVIYNIVSNNIYSCEKGVEADTIMIKEGEGVKRSFRANYFVNFSLPFGKTIRELLNKGIVATLLPSCDISRFMNIYGDGTLCTGVKRLADGAEMFCERFKISACTDLTSELKFIKYLDLDCDRLDMEWAEKVKNSKYDCDFGYYDLMEDLGGIITDYGKNRTLVVNYKEEDFREVAGDKWGLKILDEDKAKECSNSLGYKDWKIKDSLCSVEYPFTNGDYMAVGYNLGSFVIWVKSKYKNDDGLGRLRIEVVNGDVFGLSEFCSERSLDGMIYLFPEDVFNGYVYAKNLKSLGKKIINLGNNSKLYDMYIYDIMSRNIQVEKNKDNLEIIGKMLCFKEKIDKQIEDVRKQVKNLDVSFCTQFNIGNLYESEKSIVQIDSEDFCKDGSDISSIHKYDCFVEGVKVMEIEGKAYYLSNGFEDGELLVGEWGGDGPVIGYLIPTREQDYKDKVTDSMLVRKSSDNVIGVVQDNGVVTVIKGKCVDIDIRGNKVSVIRSNDNMYVKKNGSYITLETYMWSLDYE